MQGIVQPDRRRWMQLAMAGVAGLLLPVAQAGKASFKDYPFALGVASGSPRADSVVLWTRLLRGHSFPLAPAVGALAVAWEVADDAQFRRIVRRKACKRIAGITTASWRAMQSARSGARVRCLRPMQ